MRNSKLDQLCAKRIKSSDFAQKPKYQPLLTRTEFFAFLIIFLMVAICTGYLTITTYFAQG
ncbi:hypothetical protein [Acinetobacter wuhouensis]|uniref:Uncharacterized protein n=1 Tax=Acinetobacter wuhouensis TaxID=1879050 RepID=A0A4Q7AH03_9GAMM|nr:hypothetical protein [Acinetobacter wuhouensis]RZG47023.1 hypothetical protein EXU28_07485 [Acinetobacter wuhouensis]